VVCCMILIEKRQPCSMADIPRRNAPASRCDVAIKEARTDAQVHWR
jgi:hypothetical protein